MKCSGGITQEKILRLLRLEREMPGKNEELLYINYFYKVFLNYFNYLDNEEIVIYTQLCYMRYRSLFVPSN